MNVEIKNRLSGEIILCGEYASIKDCLEKNRKADIRWADLCGADLCGADLRWADLRWADLRWADLCGADLRWADLRGANLCGANWYGEKLSKEPLQIIGMGYFVIITKQHIKIGCEIHKASEWAEFNDERILQMDGKKALDWWGKNKELILMLHKKHVEDV